MKRYRVFAEVQSYSILPPNANIKADISSNSGNVSIRINNINTIDLIGKEFSKRLSIIAEIDADDILSAVGKCMYFSEQILDKIAMEVGMPVDELKVLIAFEVVKNGEVVELVKFDYDAIDKIGSKALNLTRFDSIIRSSTNDRINRAMHWYRKALNETDILDIFSYLWICLETLNPLFKDKYPDAYEISKCEKCNYEKRNVYTAPLKMFFKDILDNVQLYSTARKIRQGIVHGFEDIGNIQKNVIEIIDDLGTACRKAIIYLLGMDFSLFDFSNGVGNNEDFTFVTFLKVSNFVTDDNDPLYFIPDINIDIEMSENKGELLIKPIIKTNILNHGCGIAGLGWDIYGDPGYPVRKIQFQIKG